jgi:short-subunit dehydrogenase involved in D-alanine esterification of teichoic acids
MKTGGNTILITGGTSGIGLGLARTFHEQGNQVIVAGRRQELLDEVAAEHPGIDTIALDIADPESIARAREAVAARHPQLNVLINNAGIQLPENLLDLGSLQVAEDTIATNLLGTIRMVYAFLPLLVDQNDAAVINVSSALAFVPFPITPTYNATKAALHSFSESLRVQVAASGVQVIELVPPGVRTTLMGQQESEDAMPLGDFLTETMNLLAAEPDAKEIVVERARFIRDAQVNGNYDDLLAMFSGAEAGR